MSAVTKITPDDIENMLHKMDLIQRPYICFIHPDNMSELLKAFPDIEEKVLLQPTELMKKNKCFMMKREDLGFLDKPVIKFEV